MLLTYGQLEVTLSSHLRVHPDKVHTLRSRIKQLQRLQFPPGVNVGRGAKMEYSGEHLFLLVTVFELISIGLPAQAACNLTKEHWGDFAAGYALAALQTRTLLAEPSDQVLAVLWIHNLHEIQFGSWGKVPPSMVQISDEAAATIQLRPHDQYEDFSRLLISLGNLLKRVLMLAKDRAGVTSASQYDKEFDDWLPTERMPSIHFKGRYPDRSNLAMRQHLHHLYRNDPDSFTTTGEEEAKKFIENGYSELPDF
jgi:hypothetical protein